MAAHHSRQTAARNPKFLLGKNLSGAFSAGYAAEMRGSLRWQPAPTDTEIEDETQEIQSLLVTLQLEASPLQARLSRSSVPPKVDANALAQFVAKQSPSRDMTAPVVMAVTLVESWRAGAMAAEQRRTHFAKIQSVKPKLEDVVRKLGLEPTPRHEQSGDW